MKIEFVRSIAREAGELLRGYQQKLPELEVGRKGTPRDLVTQADLEAERLLVSRIRREFPDHAIYAEEEVRENAAGRPLWLIDPLDGTINFVHGHPHYAVSIALYEGATPRLAVVYNPAIGELFEAERGGGARRNEKPIRVSPQAELSESLLATGFPYGRQTLPNNNLENFNRLFLKVRGIRRIGVASLDLAYVACGRFDGFWELHLQPYDVAAGALLVREAGGLVTDFDRGEDWLHSGRIVATNGLIHDPLRTALIP